MTRPMPPSDLAPTQPVAPSQDAITVREVAAAVLRNKLLVLLCTLLGAAAAVALATRLTPEYAAGAALISDASMAGILDLESGETAPLIDPSATATIVETVATPVVIERALAELSPDRRAALREAADVETALETLADPAMAAEMETALLVRHLSQSLEVANSGRSYVINIYYRAEDPQTAAAIANTVAEAYLAYRAELMREAYAWMLRDVEGEIASLKVEMRDAERTAQAMREEVRLLALRSEALTGRQQAEAIAESAELYATQREAEREADATAAVYEQLLRAERMLQSRLTAPVLDVRLFAPAVAPLEASGFNAGPVLVVLGVSGGFFLGASLALLRTRRRPLPPLRLGPTQRRG